MTGAATRQPSARRALGWSFANTAIGKFGTLLIGIVIARVLGPDEFGTYAIAMVALAAVLSFNELGVSLAIVRWQEDPRLIAPTVTTISVGASVLVFAVGWILAPGFASAMGDASAAPVVQVMLLCVPLNGLVATAAAGMQREYQQGRRTIADQVNTWLGAGLSVLLALAGLGAMSLAIGRIVAAVVFSGMLLAFSPLPLRFGWDREYIRPLLRFGLPLAGASIIVFAVGYADQFVVGAVLGAQALGFYLLAFNLASWPVAMLSQPVRAVAPAAFARVQTAPDRMDSGFRSAARVLMAIALPMCAFLAGAALPVVTFVYGAPWAPAALALQWLALQGAVRIAFELAYDFLAVKRKSATLLGIQVAWLVLLVPAVLFGAQLDGIAGVAAAQALTAAIVLIAGYGWALRAASVRVGTLARALLVPLLGGAVVGVGSAVLAARIAVDLWAAVAAGVLAVVVAAGVLALSRRDIAALGSARQGTS
ncbi:oligosaccharide flippase family protein [Microbacterium memoriense]|uniref:Oligosaccharide flippase family protein n=1 Tax=Microbacterium memoriense TaxID=2978350 RepID=A0ABT2PDG4_9MICO|nr:oligosaccharide flippase family protein [Microbacterium memoriense]MCT9002628.1 oligosaccharide flippase family protein [Microbacterium memoriense]